MGWIDIAILVFIAAFAFIGYRRGFVGQLFGLAGMVISLVVAFTFCGPVGDYIGRLMHAGPEVGGILGFILLVAAVNGLFALTSAKWRSLTKSTTISYIDSIAGSLFGAGKALLVLLVLLVILVSLPIPALRQWLDRDPLTSRFLKITPVFYVLQEKVLPASVPRLLVTSAGVQLRRIDFAVLNGATCIRCGHKVEYKGFVRQGLIPYPLFVCPHCGLKSDGCLTFQGYHLIYGRCPFDKADRGEELSCLIWSNTAPIEIKGPCPVCGRD